MSLTCWSCYHYRPQECYLDCPGYPLAGPDCDEFYYEPGSDELEHTEQKKDNDGFTSAMAADGQFLLATFQQPDALEQARPQIPEGGC